MDTDTDPAPVAEDIDKFPMIDDILPPMPVGEGGPSGGNITEDRLSTQLAQIGKISYKDIQASSTNILDRDRQ